MNIPKDLRISMVAAVAQNGAIGKNGKLPWVHIPADMSRFRRLTSGKPILMGRKTHESIGRALPNRYNIVLSSLWSYNPIDCDTSTNIEHAMTLARRQHNEVVVIGGASVYKQIIDLGISFHLYLTVVGLEEPDADVFFPYLDPRRMVPYKSEVVDPGPSSRYGLQFVDAMIDRADEVNRK